MPAPPGELRPSLRFLGGRACIVTVGCMQDRHHRSVSEHAANACGSHTTGGVEVVAVCVELTDTPTVGVELLCSDGCSILLSDVGRDAAVEAARHVAAGRVTFEGHPTPRSVRGEEQWRVTLRGPRLFGDRHALDCDQLRCIDPLGRHF